MSQKESQLSRRNLLLVGLAGGAGIGVIAGTDTGQQQVQTFKQLLWSRQPGRRNVRLATASVDDWALQIGTLFQASSGHTFKLTDVRQFDHQNKRPLGMRDRAFVAGFELVSGVGQLPEQLTLQVSHKEGGTFDMFTSAGGHDKPSRRIAVFG